MRFALTSILLAISTVCLQAQPQPQPAPSPINTVRVGLAYGPRTLDPADMDDVESGVVCEQIYETLVRNAAGINGLANEVQPGLASTWSWSDDHCTLTLSLRRDKRFHDGSALDTAACKLSLDRLVGLDSSHAGNAVFPYRSEYENIREILAIDDHTLQLRVARPDASLMRWLACGPSMIVSPASLRKLANRHNGEPFLPSGTGDWRLQSPGDQQADRITLTRVGADDRKLVFRVVRDDEQRIEALRARELEVASPGRPDRPIDPEVAQRVTASSSNGVCYLSMCPNEKLADDAGSKNPLARVWLRKAITLAIDTTALTQDAFHNVCTPANDIVPPGHLGHPTRISAAVARTAERLEQARKLVRDAGFSAEQRVHIQLHAPSQARTYLPDPPALARMLKAQLAEAWIDAEVVLVPWSTYRTGITSGQYACCVVGWISDNGDPDNYLSNLFGLDATGEPTILNIPRWRSPEHQRLIDAARITFDPGARQELYERAAAVRRDAHVCVPLGFHWDSWLVANGVTGFVAGPFGRLELDSLER